MDYKAIASSVLKYSPSIAAALGGPIAGTLVSSLSAMFGVSTEALSQTIARDPSAEFKIKQVELEHAAELARIDAGNYITEITDRKNARENNSQHSHSEWIVHVLAVLITLGFFSSIITIMLTEADGSDHDILTIMMGVLGSTWVSAMSYYFGSTKK